MSQRSHPWLASASSQAAGHARSTSPISPEEQFRGDDVGARVHPRHVEVRGTEPVGDDRAPFERLVQPEDVSQRHGGVVRHDVVAASHPPRRRDRAVRHRQRLLVAAHPREDEALHPGTAQDVLGAQRVDAAGGRRESRQLQGTRRSRRSSRSCRRACGTARRAPAAGSPAPTSRARDPAARSRGPDRPPPRASRRWRPSTPIAGASSSLAPLAARELRRALARATASPPPARSRTSTGARARIASISSRPVQLGDQLGELLVGPGELLELGQRDAPAQADPPAFRVGVRELERARVEVVRLLDGHGLPSAIAGRRAGTRSLVPARHPRASGTRGPRRAPSDRGPTPR